MYIHGFIFTYLYIYIYIYIYIYKIKVAQLKRQLIQNIKIMTKKNKDLLVNIKNNSVSVLMYVHLL